MGSFELEAGNVSKAPAIRPSSPLHASDFEEERYLAGGARGFYMSGVIVEKKIDNAEGKGTSHANTGKERRSSGYGADSSLGHAQREKKAICGDDGGKKNKIYLGYGEGLQKKAVTREPFCIGLCEGEKKAGNCGLSYYEERKRERGGVGDVYGDRQWRRKGASMAYSDDDKRTIVTRGMGDGYGDESNKGRGSFFCKQEGYGNKEKVGRVRFLDDQREKGERWNAYEGEEKRGRACVDGDYKRERWSGDGERRERWGGGGGEERKKEEQGEERERWATRALEEKRERGSAKLEVGQGERGGARGEEERKKREEQGERRERRSGSEGGERKKREEGSKKEEVKEKKKGGGGGKEGEVDYVHRGQWLRAAILGANDGLVSTASLMMGVGAIKQDDDKAMIISGLAGLVGGACSMAIGEFVSVYSQRDAETFDKIKKGLDTKESSPLGDEAIKDLEEGKSRLGHLFFSLEEEGSHELTSKKGALCGGLHAIKQEVCNLTARDTSQKQRKHKRKKEVVVGPSPWEAAGASGLAFALGAMVPLLSASFIKNQVLRLGILMGVSSGALMFMGAIAAKLSAGNVTKGGVRVLLGGWAAMLVTYGLLRLFGTSGM